MSNRAIGESGSIPIAGYQYLSKAYDTLTGDASFNARRVVVDGAVDTDWNREWLVDQTGGEYGPHGSSTDYTKQLRRLAYGVGAILGPLWNPSFTMRHASRGMMAYHAQWIDSTHIDIWIRHDGGNDIVLAGDSTIGWYVVYDTKVIGVSAVTKMAGNRLRLTLAQACPGAEMITVGYGTTGTRVRLANTTLDNRLDIDSGRLVPSAVTGSNRVAGALRRNLFPLAVNRSAPVKVL